MGQDWAGAENCVPCSPVLPRCASHAGHAAIAEHGGYGDVRHRGHERASHASCVSEGVVTTRKVA